MLHSTERILVTHTGSLPRPRDLIDVMLAENEGIFTETAGGVVISGLKRLVERGAIKRDEVTVAYITGNGLKTLEAVEELVNPVYISPTMAAFHEQIPNP